MSADTAALQSFTSQEAFIDAGLEFITSHLQKTLDNEGQAALFLSGGSTPGPIYARLSDVDLDWHNIHVAQVDDRWVPLSSPGSNAALIRHTLLKNNARHAPFTRMKSRHKTASAGQATIAKDYDGLDYDRGLAVLGMGTDGHTAGWFPESQGLGAALDLTTLSSIQAIQAMPSPVAGDYLDRITLTLSALARCAALLLLITGTEKRRVLDGILSGQTPDLPLAHLIRATRNRLSILYCE